MSRPLLIGIDARAASHPQPGGFKTYVTNLVDGLAAVDDVNRYELYTDRPTGIAANAPVSRFTVNVVQSRMPVVGPVWREQALIPLLARSRRVNLVHFPSATLPAWQPVPAVVTVYDAIEHMPASVTGSRAWEGTPRRRLMRLYNRYGQWVAAKRAGLVLTISESSRKDLAEHLGIPDGKLRVVPLAAGPEFHVLPLSCARTDSPAGPDPFILAVGSADPRKNLERLICAYAELPSSTIAQYRLVLVWTHALLQGRLLDLAREKGIAARISSVAAPTNEELCRLYNDSTAFVFPSLYEGFGLPPLEAMACGTPVIASNTSSLPEVLGDAALLFDPRSTSELSHALHRLLTDDGLRRELSRRGVERARQYSWERSAAQTVQVYEEAASCRTADVVTRGFDPVVHA